MAFCGAEIRSGFDVVAEQIGLEAAVREADIVITGEGRLDAQTLQGKAPAGVARLARACGKRVYAIVGEFGEGAELRALFDGILAAKPEDMRLDVAIRSAASLLRQRARELAERLRQNDVAAP
jgi:glycerate kinase